MQDPPKTGRGAIVHRFPMRNDFQVEIALPEDLTLKDVKRLYRWLQTLPFDQRRTRGEEDAAKRSRGGVPIVERLQDLAFGGASIEKIVQSAIESELGRERSHAATASSLRDKWLRAVAENTKLKKWLSDAEGISRIEILEALDKEDFDGA